MTGRTWVFIAVMVCLSPGLAAKMSSVDSLLSLFSEEKKITKKSREFNGLKFAFEEAQVSCVAKDSAILNCRVAAKGELVFQKKNISSSSALPLVRLARKQGWQGQYRLINLYVEDEIATGLGPQIIQRAIAYHLDNILWPVLIRAFDVVIDEHTCISITTKCDFRDWPAVEKEISSIEASLSRTARH